MRLSEITPKNRDILNTSMIGIGALTNKLESLSKILEKLLDTLNQQTIESAVLPPIKRLLDDANQVLNTTWFDNDLDLIDYLNRIKNAKENIETIFQNRNIIL